MIPAHVVTVVTLVANLLDTVRNDALPNYAPLLVGSGLLMAMVSGLYGAAQGAAGWVGMAAISRRTESIPARAACAAIATLPLALVVWVVFDRGNTGVGGIVLAVSAVGAFLVTAGHEARVHRALRPVPETFSPTD